MNTNWRNLTTATGLLILRLGFGTYLMTHGWRKLQWLLAGDFDRFGDPIGLGSGLSLVLIVIAEFFAPLLVILGLLTRFAAVPTVIAMAVAAFVAHGADPWTATGAAGGASRQPAMMFFIAFLTLIFTGAGRFSLDALIWRKGAAR
jgi:putative oxidoreductase